MTCLLGKVLVHEWAHLRWGVYDENDDGQPFYKGAHGGIQATRVLSKNLKGFFDCPTWNPIGFRVEPFPRGFYMEPKIVIPGVKKGYTWNQKGFSYGDSRRTFLEPFFLRVYAVFLNCIILSFDKLLFMYTLKVTRFCSKKTHNREAPNAQNRMCDNRDVMDVIFTSSVDAKANVQPLKGPHPAPRFTVMQRGQRVVCLVLDVSGSMHVRYCNITYMGQFFMFFYTFLCFPKKIYVDFQELCKDNGNTMGDEIILLTDGESELDCVSEVKESGAIVNTIALGPSANKELKRMSEISGKIPLKGLSTQKRYLGFFIIPLLILYSTTIFCMSAVKFSRFWTLKKQSVTGNINTRKQNAYFGTVSAVDFPFKADEKVTFCMHTLFNSLSIIFILLVLIYVSGGKYFYASDNLDQTELVNVFASLTTTNGDFTHQTILVRLDSSGMKRKGILNGTVSVDHTVGNKTTFLVLHESQSPEDIEIKSPSGQIYDFIDFQPSSISKTHSLVIQGTAEVLFSMSCYWTYTIKNTLSDQSITITITSRAVSEAIPPVTVKAYMSQQSIDGSKPMLVYAEVNQKGVPVILADVMATLESDAGDQYQLELLDNGAVYTSVFFPGADAFRNDGIYSRFFTTSKKGRYNLKVKVQRKDKGKNNGQVRLKRHSVAPYVPGYVIKGKVVMNPPKPPFSEDDLQDDVGSFTRTAIGESFSVSLPPGVPPKFPPNKITDLNAEIEEDKVMLTWTAPGEDMDQGTGTVPNLFLNICIEYPCVNLIHMCYNLNFPFPLCPASFLSADSYEIRVSMDLEALRGNFSGAHLMNTSDIQPLEAGSTEEYSFLSSYIINAEPETVMFFAWQATGKDDMN
ncbi:LOW QUALITY PROTEIN: calcium-activated chloride channel regulator 4A-like [Salmo trutta]|uniref:LOW QUALITY PROTEIN: calcium-activated chloride channel regulator 4A-like n=1 Tax=Salmo trutta TaxID=8032 RepID=UPI0011314DC7|nr:LOW QUALITY PROTEIN: calcium-activated chloride channel regulator 4A-like [Salmo trutta]